MSKQYDDRGRPTGHHQPADIVHIGTGEPVRLSDLHRMHSDGIITAPEPHATTTVPQHGIGCTGAVSPHGVITSMLEEDVQAVVAIFADSEGQFHVVSSLPNIDTIHTVLRKGMRLADEIAFDILELDAMEKPWYEFGVERVYNIESPEEAADKYTHIMYDKEDDE